MIYVVESSVIIHTLKFTGELILERNLTNVTSVARSSIGIQILQFIREFILERNLTNVMSVAAASVERHTWQSIKVFIRKGNLTKVKTVEKPFLKSQPSLHLLWFSCEVMSDSLQIHGLQHTRLPCPSLSSGVCANSCPLSQGCCLTISSSVSLFCFCLQSFPASRAFSNQSTFRISSQGTGASASTSVFPMNIQG